VKATKTWSVRFEGALDDAAREALDASPELGTVATDGRGRHRIVATGATAEEAIRRVRAAVDGRGELSGFEAEPMPG
jgi:hypothetical protein